MRGVVHDRYGPPEVLRVEEVVRPVPEEGEVLVRVYASTVTRGEAMAVRSADYRFTRIFTGLRRPRNTAFGSEFAGRVEQLGPAATELRVGDDVFGVQTGAAAEYVAVREDKVIAPKPNALTFEEAAAVPDGSLLGLSCLRPAEPLTGKSVVVYGAAGSIGTAAVQLLVNHFGAQVTAVCDTKDVELVRSLGARKVLDRFHEDFTATGETYDVVFDAVGMHSFRRCRRSLKAGGIYITVDLGFMYHVPLLALTTRSTGRRRARLGIGRYRREDLLLVKELVEAGKYRPVVDRTYPLDEVVEATRYVETGQKTGNVVLLVSGPERDEPKTILPNEGSHAPPPV
jgi:NADPH:quinone reductase-like Zn-dependent oxidoreductase